MAWIESHDTLEDHPKTRKLARTLEISIPTAIGHLHCLWWWAMKYAQTGDLTKFEAGDVADAARWEGDAQAFLQALLNAGFIDPDMQIHDWYEYAGRLIEKRKANAERTKAWRMHNVRVRYDATKPNQPNQTNLGSPPVSPPKKPVKKDEPKTSYADLVTMTETEHAALVDKHGADAQRLIEILNNYKAQSGKRYKSDYHAILNWCVKRLEEERAKDKPQKARDAPLNTRPGTKNKYAQLIRN